MGVGLLLTVTSCDDFLDKQPIDKVDANAWFATETDLELYANGLIQSYLPSESSIGLGDAYCDLVCTKTSSDYYRPGIWNSSKQTGWAYSDWANIRRVNYMLDNMTRSKGKIDDEVYQHYEGVARFWRALFYYNKVRTFGDVPWIDHVPEQADSILFASRDDREFVMHKVLEDLNVACSQLKGSGKYIQNRTVVNRWVALALKSRVCLFEGTYRKYHSANPSTAKPWNGRYESADTWLRECVKASEELISEGPFKLFSTGNPSTDYRTIFTSTDPFATNEAIWVRECANATLNVFNELTWNLNSSTYGQQYAPTKTLMDMYLKTDGTPIDTIHPTTRMAHSRSTVPPRCMAHSRTEVPIRKTEPWNSPTPQLSTSTYSRTCLGLGQISPTKPHAPTNSAYQAFSRAIPHQAHWSHTTPAPTSRTGATTLTISPPTPCSPSLHASETTTSSTPW